MMLHLYELDHVFICTEVGAPEAERLIRFGLTEGTPNTHPGQGTANRRFFFRNAMIELLYVTDLSEAASEGVRRTALLQRWQRRHPRTSPYGVCLRPGSGKAPGPPFSAWAYHPSYSPAPIYLATNGHQVTAPLLFYTTSDGKPDARKQPLKHAAGLERVTALRIRGPMQWQASAELQDAARTGMVVFTEDDEHMMEIGFDDELKGNTTEFSPDLPLKLCW